MNHHTHYLSLISIIDNLPKHLLNNKFLVSEILNAIRKKVDYSEKCINSGITLLGHTKEIKVYYDIVMKYVN